MKTNLMSIWILAGTVNSMPFLSSDLKKAVNLMAGLFTIKKWSPTAAEEFLKLGKSIGGKIGQYNMTQKNKIIIKNLIESMMQMENL
jgi:hypothetical protein